MDPGDSRRHHTRLDRHVDGIVISRESYADIAIVVICLAIYIANRTCGLLTSTPLAGFAHSHLNDFLAGMVFLASINLLASALHAPMQFRSVPWVLGLCLICSVTWEFITPLYRRGSVTDVLDIVAYFAAGCIYLVVMMILRRTGRDEGR